MSKAKIGDFCFQYDSNEMTCFADQENERMAFIVNDEIQLIIDFIDGKLTFHPDVRVNIIEVQENLYQIKSYY